MPDGAPEIRDDGGVRPPSPPETRLAPLGSSSLAPEPRAALLTPYGTQRGAADFGVGIVGKEAQPVLGAGRQRSHP